MINSKIIFFIKIILFNLIAIFFLCSNFINIFAHPHPMVEILWNQNKIIIHSLHPQKLDLQYVKNNLILEWCEFNDFYQDISKLDILETYVEISHNCPVLLITLNTLFEDYWWAVPIFSTIRWFEWFPPLEKSNFDSNKFSNSYTISWFQNYNIQNINQNIIWSWAKTSDNSWSQITTSQNISTKNFINIWNIQIPNNWFIIFPLMIFVWMFFAIIWDFFNLFVPITLSSKYLKDKWLWLKAWIVHLISTFIFIYFTIEYIKFFYKYIWIWIVFIWVFMIFEKYIQKFNFSPLLISLIPCSASIFIFWILYNDFWKLAYLWVFLMWIWELFVLKLWQFIPIPVCLIKYIPIFVIISWIIIAIKLYI